ncbi:MAG: TFIIB-type zinc ribbon-containing protein [Myxococcales bacterium]
MQARVLDCPKCGAPLAPSRFARSVVCPFCRAQVQVDPHAVSTARFKEARRLWETPPAGDSLSLGGRAFTLGPLLAHGDVADVHLVTSGRWPRQRAVLKILRSGDDGALFDREWEILEEIRRSDAPGAERFTLLLPEPIARGPLGGYRPGARAMLLRFSPGFDQTLEQARGAFPAGLEPVFVPWLWRRILEILSFLHCGGFVHGAVLPPHVLVQTGDHGLKLLGYGCADRSGVPLRAAPERWAAFYPTLPADLAPETDLVMSARCVAFALGGDPTAVDLPRAVPEPLAGLVRRVAARVERGQDAWSLREEVGAAARAAFGPPSFHPLVMPAGPG